MGKAGFQSVCPGCRKPTFFEASQDDVGVAGLLIIRCRLCRTAIGVAETHPVGGPLSELRSLVERIAAKVGVHVSKPPI